MLRERLLSFGMVLVIGFLLLISFLLSTILSTFSGWIEAILKLPTRIWGGVGFTHLACSRHLTLRFDLQGPSRCKNQMAGCMGRRVLYRSAL